MGWNGPDRILDPFNYTGWNKADPYSVDMSSAPTMPGFVASNPDAYKAQLAGIGTDRSGLDAFKKDALRTGGQASAWAGLAGQQQTNLAANAKEQGARENASQTAGAQAGLAMRGGLNSGAAERTAASGAKNYMDMSQNVGRQLATNKLGIATTDEQNRIAMEGQLPGMQQAADTFDMSKASAGYNAEVQANQAKNAYNQNAFNTQGQMWGSAQNANSTAAAANAPKRGTWLCTEANPDNLSKNFLSKLKRYGMKNHRDETRFYVHDCVSLLSRMRTKNADWNANKRFVAKIVTLIEAGDMLEAYAAYKSHLLELIAKYWPDCSHPAYIKTTRSV